MKINRAATFAIILLTVALIIPCANPNAQAGAILLSRSMRATAAATSSAAQSILVIPEPFAVAPGQPAPETRSTAGLINAVCDVTLNIVGCGFMPTEITISCDVDAHGAADVVIPLDNITLVNRLLIQARLRALSPDLPGSPFPLNCCGGVATLTLARRIGAGDDNIFGPFTESISVPIDLGTRAPVVLSATQATGSCAVEQDLLITGSCFVLPDGKPNVTSVFAVDRSNPANVIQAKTFVVINGNLIDALFDFGAANAGRTFLIYASGPNGTSRNLTALPEGVATGCPLGNEAGRTIAFTCAGASVPGTGDTPPPPTIPVAQCQLQRNSAGAFELVLFIGGAGAPADTVFTVGGVTPKKIRFAEPISADPPRYRVAILKGRICKGLPGTIAGFGMGGLIPVTPFFCGETCPE